jgi:hypothetical protein
MGPNRRSFSSNIAARNSSSPISPRTCLWKISFDWSSRWKSSIRRLATVAANACSRFVRSRSPIVVEIAATGRCPSIFVVYHTLVRSQPVLHSFQPAEQFNFGSGFSFRRERIFSTSSTAPITAAPSTISVPHIRAIDAHAGSHAGKRRWEATARIAATIRCIKQANRSRANWRSS